MIKRIIITSIFSIQMLLSQSVNITYNYDSIDRMKAVSYSSGQNIDYTYDAAGNIINVIHNGVVTDIDGDGIPDHEDPNLNDGPLADNDGDGDLNQNDPDDDNDGMPDNYEVDNGLDPLDDSDVNTDADSDGYTNLEEYQAGTDPQDDSSSTFSLAIVGQTKYFLDDNGTIGNRTYDPEGTYSGSITLTDGTTFSVDGTYDIVAQILTLDRLNPTIVTQELIYLDEDAGVMRFDVAIDEEIESQAYFYDTKEERDEALPNQFNPAVIMYLLN